MRRTGNSMRRLISFAIIGIVFVCSFAVDYGGHSAKAVPVADDCDWPMFGRTPEGNRVVPDGCGPKTDNLELKWKWSKDFTLSGNHERQFVFYKDKAYFLTDFGKLFCFSVKPFKKLWDYQSQGEVDYFDNIVINNNNIYFKSGELLYCINSSTGNKLWEYNISNVNTLTFSNNKIYFESSYIEEDKMYYLLYCVSEANGRLLKTYDLVEKIEWSGLYIDSSNIYVNSVNYFINLSISSGNIIWKCDKTSNNYCFQGFINNKVIFSINQNDINTVICINANTGNMVWDINNHRILNRNLIKEEEMIITLNNESFINCLSVNTGDILWTNDLSIVFGDFKIISLQDVYNNMVLIRSNNKLCCLSLDKGKLLWINELINCDDCYIMEDQSFINNGQLILAISDYGWIALSMSTGDIVWKYLYNNVWYFHGYITKDYIIFVDTNKFVCKERTTGNVLWEYRQKNEYIVGGLDNLLFIASWSNLSCYYIDSFKNVWEREIGSSFLSPASNYNDRVVVGSVDGYLYCFSKDNKQVLWRFKTDSGVFSSPTILNSKVLFSSFNGKFYCLSLDNGKRLWELSFKSNIVSSSIAVDNKIYLGIDTGIYCLDVNTGKTIWHYKMGSRTSDVVINEFDSDSLSYWNGNLYISFTSGKVVCLSASTGKTIWEFESGESKWHTQVPVISNGKVYCIFDKLYCLSADKGKLLWTYKDEKIERIFSPVSFKGNVIFCTSSGEIACLNEDNVKIKWITKFENEEALIPPIITNNIVFSGAVKNNYLFGLSIADGKEVWKSDTIHNLTFSLSISNNNLFIGSVDGSFYCFGE